MNKFEFTDKEEEYLKDIHQILKFGEFPNLFYAIGYDKTTNNRKIFLFYVEQKNGYESTCAIAEILDENSKYVNNIEFQFAESGDINYKYESKIPWWKFWKRLTQR